MLLDNCRCQAGGRGGRREGGREGGREGRPVVLCDCGGGQATIQVYSATKTRRKTCHLSHTQKERKREDYF